MKIYKLKCKKYRGNPWFNTPFRAENDAEAIEHAQGVSDNHNGLIFHVYNDKGKLIYTTKSNVD